MDLAGKVALVTGGGAGIGRAIGDALLGRGARVVVADLTGGDITVDLTRSEDVARMIDETQGAYGRIDVLVNNAGGYDEPTFPDAAPDHWRRTLELNLGAVMLATQRLLPVMEAAGGGAILNVASTAGLGTAPYRGVEYAVAKAGVVRLTAALANLKEEMNVRVNCVCPHTVATEGVLRALETHSLAELAPPPATIVALQDLVDAALRLIEDDALFGRTVVLWGTGSGEPRVDADAADVVRRFYQAVADGDLEAAGACFAEDAVWLLPGRSPIAGEHKGWQAIHDDFLARLRPLSGGTLKVDLVEVALADEHVVAVQHATARRGEKRLDVTACQLIRVEGGRIVAVRGHYSDLYAFDEFWS